MAIRTGVRFTFPSTVTLPAARGLPAAAQAGRRIRWAVAGDDRPPGPAYPEAAETPWRKAVLWPGGRRGGGCCGSRVPQDGPADGPAGRRWRVRAARADLLAAEEPLGIRVDGTALTMTMRTPGDDVELAAGFLVGEAIVRGRDDIAGDQGLRRDDAAGTSTTPDDEIGNIVDVALAPGVAVTPGRAAELHDHVGLRGLRQDLDRRHLRAAARRRCPPTDAVFAPAMLAVAARPAAGGAAGVLLHRRAARGGPVHRRRASCSRCARTSGGTTRSTRSSAGRCSRTSCR